MGQLSSKVTLHSATCAIAAVRRAGEVTAFKVGVHNSGALTLPAGTKFRITISNYFLPALSDSTLTADLAPDADVLPRTVSGGGRPAGCTVTLTQLG